MPDAHQAWRMLLVAALAAAAALITTAAAGAPPPVPPDDPGWAGQWGLRLIGAPDLWAFASPSAHPVIAFVDTGIDSTFPDLQGTLVPGWNVADDTASTGDATGHGTDVAIVAAANADNHYGLAGACPMCRLMPVRVSDDGEAAPKQIAAGIRWAVDHGARIVSVSFAATGTADADEQAAVAYAGARGAVVIAAVGNDGTTALHYPAALRGVVSVAATDENDTLYPWSTYGGWVDLAAPGCEYGQALCGSSFAPPLVAASMGLLLAAAPTATPVQAINALRATAVHVTGIGGGRIDVRAAADALGIPPVPPAAGTVQPIRQVHLESGVIRSRLTLPVVVAKGPLTAIFTARRAESCSMSLRSPHAVYLTWRTAPNELDISATVAGGRYVLGVSCPRTRAQPYSISISGRFPR